jgi:hypothetical protein
MYQRLSWLIYKTVVFKRHEEEKEIKKLYIKKGLGISFKDALLNKTQKSSKYGAIKLFLKRDHRLIAAFLGDGDSEDNSHVF